MSTWDVRCRVDRYLRGCDLSEIRTILYYNEFGGCLCWFWLVSFYLIHYQYPGYVSFLSACYVVTFHHLVMVKFNLVKLLLIWSFLLKPSIDFESRYHSTMSNLFRNFS